jgi:heavy metal-associated domain protein
MAKIYVKIKGIHCQNCETTIQKALLKLPRVKEVTIKNFIAHITYEEPLTNDEIINAITKAGYITKASYISNNLKDLEKTSNLKQFLLIFTIIILIISLTYKIFGFNIFNVIPTIDSNITYTMLFLTGFLTSIHCVSMCGAINLIAILNQNSQNRFERPLKYNLGRLISYTILGGIAGLLGSILTINNIISGIIITIAGLAMFVMSLEMLGLFRIPRIKFLSPKHKKSSNPFLIGLLNGLMPCGPLQAMQLYALSTSSMIKGALSMFLFGLGTMPLMLLTGVIFTNLKGKNKILINNIASTLILVLSLLMLNRGLVALNINIPAFEGNTQYLTPNIIDDTQVVEFDLSYNGYQDIKVEVAKPVKMIIHVDKKYLTGCNNSLIIPEYNINQELKTGDNIIEFYPTKEGTFIYTCWMNMLKNNIKVVNKL